MEGLMQGGTAPTTAANAGVQLPPDLSRQYELGVKTTLGKALLTVALFDINEAFEYTDPKDNVYKAAGREDHKGVEIGITGKVARHLNMFGGMTLLRPRVTNDAANPALDGRLPTNVAERLFKLYGEYEAPQVRGLAFTAGIYHTGSSFVDVNNLYPLPAFTRGDLGVRYLKKVEMAAVIFRVTVTNVLNKSYWTSVTGTNLYTGDPRNVAASVQVRF
jgi:iron complex outermembrane recepter protein